MKFLITFSLAVLMGLCGMSQSTIPKLDITKKDGHQFIKVSLESTNSEFEIVENNLLSNELKNEHPNLRSYDLIDYESKTIGKLTLSENKCFLVTSKKGALQCYELSESNRFLRINSTNEKVCGTKDSPKFFGQNHIPAKSNSSSFVTPENLNFGDELRTFRLAVICTGEFTQENGGSSSALAVTVNTVNALNLIFEKELSVNLILAETVMYENPATDPFDPNGDLRTNQAAEAMAMNFANSDFDLGHVFHANVSGGAWSSGGLAGIGTVCDNGTSLSTGGDSDGLSGPNKGAAWSGSFNNTNNNWIQLAAHEFGHQFDAFHSFNGGGNGNCLNGISSSNGYEIGSGTTIMSYSGLCSADQNVPSAGVADNYFHSTSIDRMNNYINSNEGICVQLETSGNNIPQAHTNFSSAPIIPIGTPFELIGIGTDSDTDELVFNWEQIDEDGAGTPTQGFIGSEAANSPLAPLFRSVPPSLSSTRIFPALANILNGNNQNIDFEALPEVSRSIEFAFMVRDQNGGLASDGYTVESSSSAGPFKITSQNTETLWSLNDVSTATITWDVAETDNVIVDCQNVSIYLSTDNGSSFPIELAASTENDGSFSFPIPNILTSTARIKIKAVNNIFFDINDHPIEIDSSCAANGATIAPEENVMADEGDPSLDLNLSPNFGTVLTEFSGTLETSDSATSLAAAFNGACINYNLNQTFSDNFSFQVDEQGAYTFTKTSGAFGLLVHVYEGEYFPDSPCSNWIAGSFNTSTSQIQSSVTVELIPGIDYILVIAGFSGSFPSSLPAPYSYTYSGAGNAVSGGINPSGYEYNYLVVDNTTGLIQDIIEEADLSNYSPGSYTVYGLSFSPISNGTSMLVGIDFSQFQSDLILQSDFCGSLSSNSVDVQINGNLCSGDLNQDGAVTTADLTILLSDFGCAINCTADLNNDGQVTSGDLTIFLAVFGSGCQ